MTYCIRSDDRDAVSGCSNARSAAYAGRCWCGQRPYATSMMVPQNSDTPRVWTIRREALLCHID